MQTSTQQYVEGSTTMQLSSLSSPSCGTTTSTACWMTVSLLLLTISIVCHPAEAFVQSDSVVFLVTQPPASIASVRNCRRFRSHPNSLQAREAQWTRLGAIAVDEGNEEDSNGDSSNAFVLEQEYDLLEQKITERGEIEELLMANGPSRLLLANEPAASVQRLRPRGFGGAGASIGLASRKKKGGKKNTGSEKSASKEIRQNRLVQTEQAMDHARVLKAQGLVRIDNILADEVTDALRSFVYDIRTLEANKLIQATTMADKFPTIRRWDVSIPLFEYSKNNDPKSNSAPAKTIAHQALYDLLSATAVGETMRRFLGTDQAELYELGCYISDPGSSRQVVHADTPCCEESKSTKSNNDDQAILCTCFVALQDISPEMGPTLFLPQTNTRPVHNLFFAEEEEAEDEYGATATADTPLKDRFLQTQPSVVGLLPKGSCIVFDSRLLHCGTRNKSIDASNSRALLFFSFKHPKFNLFNPGGDTASIRTDLKGRFRLGDFL